MNQPPHSQSDEHGPGIPYREEVGRKLIHLSSATFPVLYAYTTRETMLWILVPLVLFALSVELLRFFVPAMREVVRVVLGPILRPVERRVFTGATYVAIACLLSVYWFPQPIAITGLLFMSISDACASLVGIRVGGVRFLGKSLAGSAAFFATAAAIVWFTMPSMLAVGLVGALVATVVEALPLRYGSLRIDDNLAIPLAAGGVMVLLGGG